MRQLAILLHRKITHLLACLVILAGAAGCGQPITLSQSSSVTPRAEAVDLPTGVPPLDPSPTSTRVIPLDSLTPSPTPTVTPIPAEVRGLVTEVIDGDTIAVVLAGDSPRQTYEVRYIGIEAPPNTPADPWGVVAYETNRKMTNLKVVRLVGDETELDDEGRLLRYVYLNDQLLSIILTEQGLARAAPGEPNTRFETEIEEAETRAREGELGIWSETAPTATPSRTRSPVGQDEERPAEAEGTAEPGPEAEETPAPVQTPEPTETPSRTPTRETVTPSATPTPTAAATTTPDETPTPSPSPTVSATPDDESDAESRPGPR